MLFYIPFQFLFIFIWLCLCNDYQEQVEQLFPAADGVDSRINFEQRLAQISRSSIFYKTIAIVLYSLAFAILVSVRYALVEIQRRRPCGMYLSSMLYYIYASLLFGYYYCQFKCENYDAVRSMITYYRASRNTITGSDSKVLQYATNIYFVRTFSNLFATASVAGFIQSDLHLISQKTAYKGALLSSALSLLIGWLIFQGQQVKLKEEQLNIIKEVDDVKNQIS